MEERPRVLFVTLLLSTLAKSAVAQSSKFCTSCELNIKCWDRQDDLVDGIIEYNRTVNADGCLQLSMICRMENESPLGFALLTVGEYSISGPVTVVCDSTGNWSPYPSNVISCGVYHDPDDPAPETSSPTCKERSRVTFDDADLSVPAVPSQQSGDCQSCGIKAACVDTVGGLKDGAIDWQLRRGPDGCTQITARCTDVFRQAPTDFAQLKVGEYQFDREVTLPCLPNGGWVPSGATTFTCGVFINDAQDRLVENPTCTQNPLMLPEFAVESTSTVVATTTETVTTTIPTTTTTPITTIATETTTLEETSVETSSTAVVTTSDTATTTVPTTTTTPTTTTAIETTTLEEPSESSTLGTTTLTATTEGVMTTDADLTRDTSTVTGTTDTPSNVTEVQTETETSAPSTATTREQTTNRQTVRPKVKTNAPRRTTTKQVTRPQSQLVTNHANNDGACCSQWSNWIEVTPCPETCGGCGTQKVRRICITADSCPCPGGSEAVLTCNRQVCPYPRTSCCPPFKRGIRNRQILCVADNELLRPAPVCAVPKCCPPEGIWGEWTDTGTCSAICGMRGNGVRQRECLTERRGCPCKGQRLASGPCPRAPCPPLYGSSCAHGFAVMKDVPDFRCRPTTEDVVKKAQCCLPGGVWEQWSSWSPCPQRCGACATANRSRRCASQKYGCPCKSASTQSLPCNTQACTGRKPCCAPFVPTDVRGKTLCVHPSTTTARPRSRSG